MDEIPVTFELKGKEHKGIFSKVSGGGTTSLFHLMVDGFYWGQLFYNEHTKAWNFYSNTEPELTALSDYFGDVVMLWYE